MTKKEELVKQLNKVFLENAKDHVNGHTVNLVNYVADFIIEDRKRIVEPLVKLKKTATDMGMSYYHAMNETLTNAGITNEEKTNEEVLENC